MSTPRFTHVSSYVGGAGRHEAVKVQDLELLLQDICTFEAETVIQMGQLNKRARVESRNQSFANTTIVEKDQGDEEQKDEIVDTRSVASEKSKPFFEESLAAAIEGIKTLRSADKVQADSVTLCKLWKILGKYESAVTKTIRDVNRRIEGALTDKAEVQLLTQRLEELESWRQDEERRAKQFDANVAGKPQEPDNKRPQPTAESRPSVNGVSGAPSVTLEHRSEPVREVAALEVGTSSGSWSSLPKFTGSGPILFAHWLRRFEDHQDLETGITPERKFARLKFLLGGTARAVVDGSGVTSYDDAVDLLKTKFAGKAAKSLANQTLANIRKKPNETVLAYSDRVLEVTEVAANGEDPAIRQHLLLSTFVRGLDDYLKIKVKGDEPTEYEGAVAAAQKHERLREEELYLKEMSEPASTRTASSTRTTGTGYDGRDAGGKIICGQCGRKGHGIVKCRAKNLVAALEPVFMSTKRVASVAALDAPWRKLQPYSGASGQTFREWRRTFEDLLELGPLSEAQKCAHLKIVLSGNARTTYDEYARRTGTGLKVADALDELSRKFNDKSATSLAEQRLGMLTQGPNEDVAAYSDRVLELVNQATILKPRAVKHHQLLTDFLKGLRPRLRIEVKREEPEDYDEAVAIAMKTEVLQQEEDELCKRGMSVMAAYSNSEGTSQMDVLNARIEQLEAQLAKTAKFHQVNDTREIQRQRNDRRPAVKCYNCGIEGHMSSACRKPRVPKGKCYECGGIGHFARDCLKRAAPRPSVRFQDEQPEASQSRLGGGNAQPVNQQFNPQARTGAGTSNQVNTAQTQKTEGEARIDKGIGWESRAGVRLSKHHVAVLEPVRHVGRRVNPGNALWTSLLLLTVGLSLTGVQAYSLRGTAIRPLMCHSKVTPSYWELPRVGNCKQQLKMLTPPHKTSDLELTIFQQNGRRYESTAYHCMVKKYEIKYYENLLGDPFVHEVATEDQVTSEECHRMVGFRTCRAGSLAQAATALWTTKNKPELKLHYSEHTKEYTDCFLFKTTVEAWHGREFVETGLGGATHCRYEDGACGLADGSMLVWEQEREEKCQFLKLKSWKGTRQGQMWKSDDEQFALTFADNPRVFHDCDQRPLYVSIQGYAVLQDEWDAAKPIEMSNESGGKRSKRAGMVYTEGVVMTPQLAAQLTFAGQEVQFEVQHAFARAIDEICRLSASHVDMIAVAARVDPTAVARALIGRRDLQARLIAERVLEVWPCVEIDPSNVHIDFRTSKSGCFDLLPVQVWFADRNHSMFLDALSGVISSRSAERRCADVKPVLVPGNQDYTRVDARTEAVERIPRGQVQQLTSTDDRIESPAFSRHLTFKNLVLTNITDLIPSVHFESAQQEAEQIRSAIVQQSLVEETVQKAASEQLGKVMSGNWLLRLLGIELDWWKIGMTSCVAILMTYHAVKITAWFIVWSSKLEIRAAIRSAVRRRAREEVETSPFRTNIESGVQFGQVEGKGIGAVTEKQTTRSDELTAKDQPASTDKHDLTTHVYVYTHERDQLVRFQVLDQMTGRPITTRTFRRTGEDRTHQRGITEWVLKVVKAESFAPSVVLHCGRMCWCSTASGKQHQLNSRFVSAHLKSHRIEVAHLPKLGRSQRTKLSDAVNCQLERGMSESSAPEVHEVATIDQYGREKAPPMAPMLVVIGEVAGQRLKMLLDTGASVSMASMSLARTLGIERFDNQGVEVYAVGGTRANVLGSKVLEMRVGPLTLFTRFHFVESLSPLGRYQVIVGCDALRRMPPIEVDLASCKVKVGGQELWVGDPDEAAVSVAEARMCCTTRIAPGSEKIVDVYFGPVPHEIQTVYATITEDDRVGKLGLSVTPAVVSPDPVGRVQLLITNLTHESVVLAEDRVVAVVEQIEDEGGCLRTLDAGADCALIEVEPRDKEFTIDISSSGLNTYHEQRLRDLLQKYDDVFSKSKFDLGSCKLVAPTITTTTQVPVRSKPRATPYKFQEELRAHLAALIKQGVIVESDTPWVSALVLVEKKDGSLRPCVDFRRLNLVTEPDHFPLPRVEAILEQIGGASYYSTLDLSSGFMQIPLDNESSYKCGLTTEHGTYRFTHLPFGLRNACSIFARIISKVLEGLSDTVVAYVDDIMIYTRGDFVEHLKALEAVFQRLRDFNLKLSPRKCVLARKKLEFLAHEIEAGGYVPADRGIKKVLGYPTPTSSQEVRTFYGMASYFRKHIPGFAKIAEPLSRLMTKDGQFEWTQEQEAAFDELKKKLVTSPILAFPNYNRPFHIYTDASGKAMGAVLMQQKEDKTPFHAVSYASRVLTPAEQKAAATHQEMGAIIYALRAFRPYVYNAEVIIHTDHKPLIHVVNQKDINGKLARWVLELRQANVKIAHVDGPKNVADALSRVVTEEPVPLEELEDRMDFPRCLAAVESVVGTLIEAREPADKWQVVHECQTIQTIDLKGEQLRDPYAGPILRFLTGTSTEQEKEKLDGELSARATMFAVLENGCLVRDEPGDTRFGQSGRPIVVPLSQQKAVFDFFHASHLAGCHMGHRKSLSKARRYYWPTMGRDFRRWARECIVCQMRSNPKPRIRTPMTIVRNSAVFERVGIDLSGPYRKTERGNVHVLNCICWFSKYLISVPIQDARAVTIAAALVEHVVLKHEACREIVSDNGPAFKSEFYSEFCRLLGIDEKHSVAYRSQGNAQTERSFQIVQAALAKTISEDQGDWDLMLPYVAFSYNTAVQDSTRESPFFLVHGRDPVNSIDLALDPRTRLRNNEETEVDDFRAQLVSNLRFAYDHVKACVEKASANQKNVYDRGAKTENVKVGSRVLMKDFRLLKGKSRKLSLPWRDQYRVVELSDAHAVVQSIANPREKPKRVHRDHIKLCTEISGPLCTTNESEEVDESEQADYERQTSGENLPGGEQLGGKETAEEMAEAMDQFDEVPHYELRRGTRSRKPRVVYDPSPV